MADQGDHRKKKISRFRQSTLTQKALLTSSASTRFKAEDEDPGSHEEQIKADLGGSISNEGEWEEDQKRAAQEAFEQEEKLRRIWLLQNVPPEYQQEVLRRDRIERRKKAAERRAKQDERSEAVKESGILYDAPDRPSRLSTYDPYTQDVVATHIRSKLSELVNRTAEAPELRGGPTKLPGPRQKNFSTIEDQMTSSGGRGPTEPRSFGDVRRDEVEELFTAKDVQWPSDTERERAEALIQRRNELKRLETRIKSKLQTYSGDIAPKPKTAEGKPIRVGRDLDLPKGSFREALDQARKPRSAGSPRERQAPTSRPEPKFVNQAFATENIASLRKALAEVVKEREQVQARFATTRANAIVEGESATPEITERRVRRELRYAFRPVTDLGDVELDKEIRDSLKPEDIEIGLKRLNSANKADELINTFVQNAVNSHHAITPAERLQAKRRADALSLEIARAAQATYDAKEEEAARDRIVRSVVPLDSYTHAGYIKRSMDPTGTPPLSEVEAAKATREGWSWVKGDPKIGKPGEWKKTPYKEFSTPFEQELWQVSGRPYRGKPLSKRTPRPVDPRINQLTAEEVYSKSSQDKAAPRIKWEKERLKAKFSGQDILSPDEVDQIKDRLEKDKTLSAEDRRVLNYKLEYAFTQPKPPPFAGIRQQGSFMRNQGKARIKGFVEGTEILGWDEKGKPISFPGRTARTSLGTNPKAKYGLAPNITYFYSLRNPQAHTEPALEREHTLNDMLQQREELVEQLSTRNSLTDLLSDDRETLQALHSLDQAITRQRQRVRKLSGPIRKNIPATDQRTTWAQGRRNRNDVLFPDEYDEQLSVVPIQAQGERVRFHLGEYQPLTGKEKPPENIDEIRYIPVRGGKGQTSTVEDPEGSSKVITQMQTVEGRWEEVSRSEYEAGRLERERWEALPRGQRRGTAPPQVEEVVIPRKIQYKYVDPKDLELGANSRDIITVKIPQLGKFNERLGYVQLTNDPNSLINKVPGKLIRTHAEAERLDMAHAIQQGHIEPTPEILQKHGIRDKSEAAQIASAAAAAGFYSQRKHFKEGHLPNIANRMIGKIPGSDKYEYGWDVNEAFIKPSVHQAAQWQHKLKHPLQSTSSGEMGLDLRRWRYRQNWIDKQKQAERALEQHEKRVNQVEHTLRFVQKNKDKRGPVGAFTRWRLGALQRSPDYSLDNPRGFVHKAISTAQEIQNEGQYTYISDKLGDAETIPYLPPRLQSRATQDLRHFADVRNQLRPSFESPIPGPHGPGFFNRAIDHPGIERNLLIGGAAVGTAAGAAYLYHRHQEQKKPEAERVSIYNKVLPPAFHGPPVPKARVTGSYRFGNTTLTNELHLKGKEIPTEFGIRTERKRIALRPMDRGYAKNAPLVGRVSVRGTPGGSAVRGLTYYGTDTPKRTNVKRSSHTLDVMGHRLPGALKIGELKDIKTTTRNPNRFTAEQRSDVIWAHQGTEDEAHVQAFFRGMGGNAGKDILETWENPEEVAKINRQKFAKSPEGRKYQRKAVRQLRRVTSASR